MAILQIHAGDFNKGKGSITIEKGICTITPAKGDTFFSKSYTISGVQIETLAIASEENVKKLEGTVGWGIAGAVLLGPVGLLAGLLLGGKNKEITFILKLIDGRKMLASTENATYTKLTALTF